MTELPFVDKVTLVVVASIDIANSMSQRPSPLEWDGGRTPHCAVCLAPLPDDADLDDAKWHTSRCEWRRAKELWP